MLGSASSCGDDLPSDRVIQVPESADCVAVLRQACRGQFSLSVDAPLGVCGELTEQLGLRFVHLVNYRANTPATNVTVSLVLPSGKSAQTVRLISPEHPQEEAVVFHSQGAAVTFRVQRVGIYEVAVVEVR